MSSSDLWICESQIALFWSIFAKPGNQGLLHRVGKSPTEGVAPWNIFIGGSVAGILHSNCRLLHMEGGNPLVMEQIILIGSLEGPEPERSQDAKDKVNTRVNAGHQFNIGIHHKEAFQVSSMETYFCTPPFFEFLSSLYLFSTCS